MLESAIRARYDARGFVGPGKWEKVQRGRKGYYDAQASTIGRLLLA